MRYNYIVVYKLNGISGRGGAQEQVLVEYPSDCATAFVSTDIDGHLHEHDKALAIGGMILGGFLGKPTEGTFEEKLKGELHALRERRQKETGEGVFLIFKASGEVESFNPTSQRKRPEFTISLGGAPKEPIRASYMAQVHGLLASIAVGCDHVYSVTKVTDSVVFVDEEGKPVYSYDLRVSGKASVTALFKDDMLAFAKNHAKSLAKHQQLVDAARLLSRSLSDEGDELLSFIAAWAGLEMFVNRTFPDYEKRAFGALTQAGQSPIPSRFLKRISQVMKDKYRLSDKFALLSFELVPDSAEREAEDFERIKGFRDNLMHGQDVDADTLPTEDVRRLLRKYLKLHIERVNTQER